MLLSAKSPREYLPSYPESVKGDLRTILQLKDLFVLGYKFLEDYRLLFEEQCILFTREFLEEQIFVNTLEIEALKEEIIITRQLIKNRTSQNKQLVSILCTYSDSEILQSSPRRQALMRLQPLRRRKEFRYNYRLDEINSEEVLRCLAELEEISKNLIPLIDFYRELYYLQLHFSLVLTRICNGIMPILTDNIGLIDRVFFWAERPELNSLRKPQEIADRLHNIYVRAEKVLALLGDSSDSVYYNMIKLKALQAAFNKYLKLYNAMQIKMLREIHDLIVELDILEEENDRLVGTIVKIDNGFINTNEFAELGQNWMARRLGSLGPKSTTSSEKKFMSRNVNNAELPPFEGISKINKQNRSSSLGKEIPARGVYSGEVIAEFSSVSSDTPNNNTFRRGRNVSNTLLTMKNERNKKMLLQVQKKLQHITEKSKEIETNSTDTLLAENIKPNNHILRNSNNLSGRHFTSLNTESLLEKHINNLPMNTLFTNSMTNISPSLGNTTVSSIEARLNDPHFTLMDNEGINDSSINNSSVLNNESKNRLYTGGRRRTLLKKNLKI